MKWRCAVLGLEHDKVKLSPYQEEWAKLFEEEKKRLEEVIGENVLDIQHIGSTAVPSLKAKPILDIGVAVENFEKAFALVAPTESLGYTYRGENGIPRRHYFVKGPPDKRTHHIHMFEEVNEAWAKHLLFRDYLRTHPETAAAYGTLKEDLAKRYPRDREAYTDDKHEFIQEVLNEALGA